jgi:hypothetical protein
LIPFSDKIWGNKGAQNVILELRIKIRSKVSDKICSKVSDKIWRNKDAQKCYPRITDKNSFESFRLPFNDNIIYVIFIGTLVQNFILEYIHM